MPYFPNAAYQCGREEFILVVLFHIDINLKNQAPVKYKLLNQLSTQYK